MKYLKISLIVLTLLTILLMTSSPAGAKVTRIDFYRTGGNSCDGIPYDMLFSGPNLHILGTYSCPEVATLADGSNFAWITGILSWPDSRLQLVDGQANYKGELRIDPAEGGGYWEGIFVWNASGMYREVLKGYGKYSGMTEYYTWNMSTGLDQGYIQINP